MRPGPLARTGSDGQTHARARPTPLTPSAPRARTHARTRRCRTTPTATPTTPAHSPPPLPTSTTRHHPKNLTHPANASLTQMTPNKRDLKFSVRDLVKIENPTRGPNHARTEWGGREGEGDPKPAKKRTERGREGVEGEKKNREKTTIKKKLPTPLPHHHVPARPRNPHRREAQGTGSRMRGGAGGAAAKKEACGTGASSLVSHGCTDPARPVLTSGFGMGPGAYPVIWPQTISTHNFTYTLQKYASRDSPRRVECPGVEKIAVGGHPPDLVSFADPPAGGGSRGRGARAVSGPRT